MRTKNIILNLFLWIFFIALVALYLPQLYFYAVDNEGWSTADWLMNFAGGFVRRGLSGHILIDISDLFFWKLNMTAFRVQSFVYISFIALLFLLIYRRKIDVWFFILLLSPVTLLFPLYDCGAIGRKEIIVFALFGLYLLNLDKKILNFEKTTWLFSILLAIACLFHELIFFYIPFFVFAAYLQSRLTNELFDFRKSLYIFIGPAIAIAAIAIYGSHVNNEAICDELLKRGLTQVICDGYILHANNSAGEASRQLNFYNRISDYGIAYALGTIPFVFFINYSQKVIPVRTFLLFILLLTFCILPLFVLAIDWGRWISIHFTLLLLTLTMFLKKESTVSRWLCFQSDISIPSIFGTRSMYAKISGKIIFMIATLSYLTFWTLYHFYYRFNIMSSTSHVDALKHLFNMLAMAWSS